MRTRNLKHDQEKTGMTQIPEPPDPPEDLECDPTTRWHEGWKAGYVASQEGIESVNTSSTIINKRRAVSTKLSQSEAAPEADTKAVQKISSEPLRDSKPALSFPIVGSGWSTWSLSEAQVAEWGALSPSLDVLAAWR